MGRSHVLIGVGAVGVLMTAGAMPFGRAALLGAVVGSLAPDIDTPYSTLGRLVPFVSVPLYRSAGHRTATHSWIGMLVAIGIAAGLEGWSPFVGLAFLVGYGMHIAADLLTREGCAVLYPIKKRRYVWWPGVRTGSFGETLTVIPILAAMAGAAYLAAPSTLSLAQLGELVRHGLTIHQG